MNQQNCKTTFTKKNLQKYIFICKIYNQELPLEKSCSLHALNIQYLPPLALPLVYKKYTII